MTANPPRCSTCPDGGAMIHITRTMWRCEGCHVPVDVPRQANRLPVRKKRRSRSPNEKHDDAYWDQIFREKFDRPEYYSKPEGPRHWNSSLSNINV